MDKFYENLKEESIPKCVNCDSVNLKYDLLEHIKHISINLLTTGTNASHGMRRFQSCLDCGYQN